MRGIIILFLLAVVAAAAVAAWPRMEGDAPQLSGPERIDLTNTPTSIDLGWVDNQTGLRSIGAYLELGSDPAERIELHEKTFIGSSLTGPARPTNSEEFSVDLDVKKMEIVGLVAFAVGLDRVCRGHRDGARRDQSE